MRRARFLVPPAKGEAVYHLISRTVNGEWLIGAAGKEVLRKLLRQVAEFAGLQVLAHTELSNHFHVLVRVPQRQQLSDEELLRRYAVLYPRPTRHQPADLAVLREQLAKNEQAAELWRRRQLALMYDISQYMKLVKERYSIWHNATYDRFGPVWSDRFKSLPVEPTGCAIEAIAAYIELNCVRGGIVQDPKDYRCCSYAEAVAGNEQARLAIQRLVGGSNWEEAHAAYRLRLFTTAAVERVNKASIPLERVQQVIKDGGRLSLAEVLRCRVRYFSEGAILGSRPFVESLLETYRERYHCGNRVKVRLLPSITDWGELAGIRALRGPLVG